MPRSRDESLGVQHLNWRLVKTQAVPQNTLLSEKGKRQNSVHTICTLWFVLKKGKYIAYTRMNYCTHKIDSSKLEKSDTGNRGQTVGLALFTSV